MSILEMGNESDLLNRVTASHEPVGSPGSVSLRNKKKIGPFFEKKNYVHGGTNRD